MISHRQISARALISLIVLLLLSGCAARFETIGFNQGAHPELEAIQSVPMRESELRAFIRSNPGYSFGLIGAMIAEADIASKSEHIQEVAASEDFDYNRLFADELSAALAERGYQMTWSSPLEEEKPNRIRRDAWGFQKRYAAMPGADAILDMNFHFIGYASAGSGDASPYRPTVIISARLMSPDGEQVLFAEQVAYHNIMYGAEEAITLEPDERYAYPGFEELDQAGTEIVEGLRIGVIEVAQELARQFGTRVTQ